MRLTRWWQHRRRHRRRGVGCAGRADAPQVYAIKGARLVTAAGPAIASGTIVIRRRVDRGGRRKRAGAGRRDRDRRRGPDGLPRAHRHGPRGAVSRSAPHRRAANLRTTEEAERWKRGLIFRPELEAASHRQGDAGARAARRRRHHDRARDASGGDLQGTERARQRRGAARRAADRQRGRLPPGHPGRADAGGAARGVSGRRPAVTPIPCRSSASSRSCARASSTRSTTKRDPRRGVRRLARRAAAGARRQASCRVRGGSSRARSCAR